MFQIVVAMFLIVNNSKSEFNMKARLKVETK